MNENNLQIKMESIYYRFSFKKMSESINYTNNPMFQQPLTKPNIGYINKVVKERKSQTLYDIWVGLGWRSQKDMIIPFEVHSSVGMEIGRLINFHLPKRQFVKVDINIDGEIMKVRIYEWYEIPFIISIIFGYFKLFQYIPKHWSYGFFMNTNLYQILRNMVDLNMSDDQKSGLCKKIMGNIEYFEKLQKILIQEISDQNVIDTNHIYKYHDHVPLYKINAKYGIAIELFILQNIEKVFD